MKKKTSATLAVMLAMTLVVGPVQPASAASVQLSATKITLKVGQTKTLKLKKATGKVTWTSSKKAVATVSSKGVVKGVSAGNTTITAKNKKKKYTCKVTVKSVDIQGVDVNLNVGGLQKIPMKLYFVDKGDIPYVSIAEWIELLQALVMPVDAEYTISCEGKGNKCTLLRNTGFTAELDCSKNTLYFVDLNGFFRRGNNSLASMESIAPSMTALFKKSDVSFDRYGSDYEIDFNKYGIKTYADGGNYYIPLQTFSDIFLSRGITVYALYNGEEVFLNGDIPMPDQMTAEYLKGTKRRMSKEFTDFNYNEICLALDYMYGLKETHGITSFDRFFTETGIGVLLKDNENNATKVDLGLKSMINYYIDDGHTRFGGISYNSDYNGNAELNKQFQDLPKGPSLTHLYATMDKLQASYDKAYPNGPKCYEEVGDTAFIKFDEFISTTDDFTSAPTEEDASKDTIRLMQYACDRILRPGSPIKKVVLDLSLNGGGLNNTAVYVLGTFLGTGTLVQNDVTTGAYSNASYQVDTNRDGVFDSKDTLAGKGLKMYCFTSNFSFSCGNMVPCRFKDSGEVTLIGQQTGGGSCSVAMLSTASGSYFRLSSPWRYSFSKNGSFYDVDRGAEPDVYIKDLSKLYDREYMAKFIDKID